MVELSFGVLDGELIQPVDNAQFTITNRPVLFVKAEANDLIGYGECAALLEPLQGDASLGGVLDQLRSVGKDRIARALRTRGGELLAPGMVASLFGTDATSRSVAAMLEMAFFDLQLKTQRQSLASWLKVTATDVEAGGFVAVHGGVTREEFEQRASDLADAGIWRFRLKIRPGFDHTPVQWLRSLLPDATICVDANGSYRIDGDDLDGPPALNRLVDEGVAHVEQPFGASNLVDHATFRSQSPLRVCLDEGVSSVVAAKQIVKYGAADAFCVKPGRVGGVIAAVEILRLAETHGIDAFLGGFFETGFARALLVALAGLPAATLISDVSSPATYGLPAGEHFPPQLASRVLIPQGSGVSGGNDGWIADQPIDWERLEINL